MRWCSNCLEWIINFQIKWIESIHTSFQFYNEITVYYLSILSDVWVIFDLYLKLLFSSYWVWFDCEVNAFKLILNCHALELLVEVWSQIKFEILGWLSTWYLSFDKSMDVLSTHHTFQAWYGHLAMKTVYCFIKLRLSFDGWTIFFLCLFVVMLVFWFRVAYHWVVRIS